jgi:hypothetical protein
VLRISSSEILIDRSNQLLGCFHHNTKLQNLSAIAQFQTDSSDSPQDISNRKFKRRRFSTDINASIARKLHEWNGPLCPTLEQIQIQDAIGDHAYRRIQIFYYQSVVYYKTGCDIALGRTELQHGTSNYAWSNAAHSSLLPNLHDNYLEILKHCLYDYGLTDRIAQVLRTLGVSKEKIKSYQKQKLDWDEIEFLLEDIDIESGLIHADSALYASMNATVELPQEVNSYDCVIEKKMRSYALKLLNRVSKEGLHPYEATQTLVSKFASFFMKSLKETREKITLLKEIESMEQNLWFTECNLTSKTVDFYIKLIRDLKEKLKQLNNLGEYSIQKKGGLSLGWRRDLLHIKKPTHKKILREVKLQSETTFPPPSRENYIKILTNSIEIIHTQWNNTRVPPFNSLSGKFVNNQLLECTDKDLYEEQLQIIKRD